MAALERVYRVALRLLPEPFRARHRDELLHVFRSRVSEARAREGATAALKRAAGETADVVATAWRLRLGRRGAARRSAPRDLRGRSAPLAGFLPDLRHAVRALVLRPGFAITAVLTLALGIGSATAIFTVADAVLLRPLPYQDSHRLVHVWRVLERYEMRRAPLSYPDFLDLRAGTRSFEVLSAFAFHSGTLVGEGDPERLTGSRFEGRMFGLLGVPVELGRPLRPADDAAGAEPVVVLAHGLWQRRFGSDPAVLGRTLDLGEVRRRVVGVAAEGFHFPSPVVEYWVPLALDPATADRDSNFLQVLARLRADVGMEAAEAGLRAAMARIQEANPGVNETDDLWLETRHARVVGEVRPILLLLLGAVALLLGLSCANLVNLLLVRASARARELGVRAALGAGAARLRHALMAESLLLATAGGALGVAGSWAAVRLLLAVEGGNIPRPGEVALDGRVLLFAAALSLLCALVCGWLPAWAAARTAPSSALRGGGRGSTGRGSGRAQAALVVAQVAMAAVLLLGAGLLGRSFARLVSVPLGFDPAHVLTAHVAPSGSRYGEPHQVDAFYDGVLDRIAALPGVVAAGATWALPFSPAYASSTYAPEGGGEEMARTIALAPVRGDYFPAMGMTLLRGRLFTAADEADSPPVAVVNETMADLFWPGQDPVGKRFAGSGPGGDGTLTVVGVVADVKRRALDEDTAPEAYLPHPQAAWDGSMYLTIRTDGPPSALAAAVRRQVWAVDPGLPVSRVEPLTVRIADSIVLPRLRTLVLGAFAVAAALIALVGIYGVLSFVVVEREREMAVRMALGAARQRVLGQVLRRGLGLAAAGLAAGLIAGAAATRALASFLFGVEPLDTLTFAGTTLLLLAAATAASWVPAWRAARVDPMGALRGE